jgi:hypothetical protein
MPDDDVDVPAPELDPDEDPEDQPLGPDEGLDPYENAANVATLTQDGEMEDDLEEGEV